MVIVFGESMNFVCVEALGYLESQPTRLRIKSDLF